MRPLDENETTAVFEKLFKFTGNNLKNIVENPSHEGPDPNPADTAFVSRRTESTTITENIVAGDGIVVFSHVGCAFGFGIAAKSTQDCRKLDPNGIVVLHQADIGEYLRMEDEL
ncbi:60S ribosome subunit biogenesis protein NIP7-like [Vitis vinifera]|uniref:60S ribosome subunit biogenesis protein NIP7-like n=1 Tax=Vitis vinifera TaxID=29760 RepID=A0A438GDC5_VITVI|nr:60S ribosome subunit biogenesis protein NIP7-like [Vitis vinifera]